MVIIISNHQTAYGMITDTGSFLEIFCVLDRVILFCLSAT